MRLVRLAGVGFRNLEPFDLRLEARFVVFHGRNAQGKTNALEAIYLLACLRPLRATRARDLVRWGADEARVCGEVEHDGLTREHAVEVSAGDRKRRAFLDGNPTRELVHYFEGIRAIAFTPQDVAIVSGEPARRRAWLDRAAFTVFPAHLEVVRSYRRLIEQKGAALRAGMNDDVLDALDTRLAEEGARLVGRRSALLDDIRPHVEQVHAALAGGGSRFGLRYRTEMVGDSSESSKAFLARLRDGRRRERERRMVLMGPHHDDVDILVEERQARTFASQGQLRTVVLALKLAELIAAEKRGTLPIFLIDDVGSELDGQRTERLIRVLSELGAQVFASTTDATHLRGLPEVLTSFQEVQGGAFR